MNERLLVTIILERNATDIIYRFIMKFLVCGGALSLRDAIFTRSQTCGNGFAPFMRREDVLYFRLCLAVCRQKASNIIMPNLV